MFRIFIARFKTEFQEIWGEVGGGAVSSVVLRILLWPLVVFVPFGAFALFGPVSNIYWGWHILVSFPLGLVALIVSVFAFSIPFGIAVGEATARKED